jgi:hypothetical protein
MDDDEAAAALVELTSGNSPSLPTDDAAADDGFLMTPLIFLNMMTILFVCTAII